MWLWMIMPTYQDTLRRLSCFIVLCGSSSFLNKYYYYHPYHEWSVSVTSLTNRNQIDWNDTKCDPQANHNQGLTQIAIWCFKFFTEKIKNATVKNCSLVNTLPYHIYWQNVNSLHYMKFFSKILWIAVSFKVKNSTRTFQKVPAWHHIW